MHKNNYSLFTAF